LALKPAIFFDKDGTLIEDRPYNVDLRYVRFASDAFESLRLLSHAGFGLFLVTNQAGVARGRLTLNALEAHLTDITKLLAQERISFDGFYFCPHHEDGEVSEFSIECDCRKPKPGLILRAAREHGIDLTRSWMVGDILNDVEAGNRAGCRSILLDNGNETEWIKGEVRTPYSRVPSLREATQVILASVDDLNVEDLNIVSRKELRW
jgi:D,D-heptose 1,7-bisphosphate phosphatase